MCIVVLYFLHLCVIDLDQVRSKIMSTITVYLISSWFSLTKSYGELDNSKIIMF